MTFKFAPIAYLVSLTCAGVFLAYAAPWRHAQAQAQDNVQASATTRVANNQLRYPLGSPQLAYLDVQVATASVPPVLEPIPARITFDEDHTVRVFSPVTGRTLRIVAQPGHRVAAGEVLALIESPDYETAIADLRKSQADHEAKQTALARAQRLFDAGVIAARDLESARLDAKTAAAETDRASARLKGLGGSGQGGPYALRAPISGVVAERHLNPGQEVRPDAPDALFIITDPTHLDVVADVPESDVAGLHAGQHIRVEADGVDLSAISGVITMVGVAVDPVTRRIPVRARLDAPPASARPEMFVRLSPLSDKMEPVVTVPNSAIVTSGLQSFVFVESAPGLLTKKSVAFAHRGRDVSYVQQGLQAGDHVVTKGAILLDAELTVGS